MTDAYSQRWFETFLETKDAEQTRAEVDGLARHVPIASYPRVLDVGCGAGRHAAELSRRGYAVTGVDRDETSLAKARLRVPNARFVQGDMRELASLGGTFDAVVSLWQSFGYFDPETNDAVLAGMSECLRPGGRLAIDLYHPAWHRERTGTHAFDAHPGTRVDYAIEGDRLALTIHYADGQADRLGWELIEPHALIVRAGHVGFAHVATCSFWDPDQGVGAHVARYQCIFDRI